MQSPPGFPTPVCAQLPHIGEAEATIISAGSDPAMGIGEYIKLPREERKVGGRLWLLLSVCVAYGACPGVAVLAVLSKSWSHTMRAFVCSFAAALVTVHMIENLERATLFARLCSRGDSPLVCCVY